MTEYRRSKRKRAAEVIEVFDTMTEQSIGRIGNISETGMMLMTGERLIEDALFQLRFTLPQGRSAAQSIEVGAHHLWSDDAHAPGQHWAGFRFIDMAPEDAADLKAWIEQPGGQYV